MKTIVAYLFTLLPALFGIPALAAEPFARSSIDAGDTIVPGEQIRLTLEIFAPGFFTSPPEFPLFDIPDALVTLPEERAQNLVETVDGVQYSGIRKQYAVVPEKTGAFVVPPINIGFAYSVDGNPIRAAVSTQSLSFNVAETAGSSVPFAAHDVQISQSFNPDPETLKVGDVLVRTTIVTAKETQAMLLPPVDVGHAAGLRQYIKPAKLEDGLSVGRGETESRRTETISYTADAEGSFNLPAIRYPWFDLDSSGQSSADLPAVRVAVTAAPVRNSIAPGPEKIRRNGFEHRREVMIWILLVPIAAGFLWCVRRSLRAIVTRLRELRSEIEMSVWYRRRALSRTILSAELPHVYAALQHWAATDGYRTLSDRIASMPSLKREVFQLERILYSQQKGNFDRRNAANALWTKVSSSATDASALPPLNPVR